MCWWDYKQFLVSYLWNETCMKNVFSLRLVTLESSPGEPWIMVIKYIQHEGRQLCELHGSQGVWGESVKMELRPSVDLPWQRRSRLKEPRGTILLLITIFLWLPEIEGSELDCGPMMPRDDDWGSAMRCQKVRINLCVFLDIWVGIGNNIFS